ncbi:MAG: hypothetical protein WCS30_00230 [Selenomonadaceae bacterium]
MSSGYDQAKKMRDQIKRFETLLKAKADRLNSKENLTPHEDSTFEEVITELQEMQDIGLIETWRWD